MDAGTSSEVKVLPSTVPGVAVFGPDSPEFEAGIQAILGRAPRDLLKPALPFCVIAENRASQGIALLGVRFDMLTPQAKHYSVVHYADTLRNPLKGDFLPGAVRLVCAEPEYTALARAGGSAPQTRGRMNLDNLRRMVGVSASLDCVAFDDGQFMGADSQGSFQRYAEERAAESALVNEAISRQNDPPASLENWLRGVVKDENMRARRLVARKLLDGLASAGPSEMLARARAHRLRIELTRGSCLESS